MDQATELLMKWQTRIISGCSRVISIAVAVRDYHLTEKQVDRLLQLVDTGINDLYAIKRGLVYIKNVRIKRGE